jgi:hypothetical protein
VGAPAGHLRPQEVRAEQEDHGSRGENRADCVDELLSIEPIPSSSKRTLLDMPDQRPFEETHPHLVEFRKFLDASNKESERGLALICAAMLDDLLERSIRAFLLDHDETARLFDGLTRRSERYLRELSLRSLSAFCRRRSIVNARKFGK